MRHRERISRNRVEPGAGCGAAAVIAIADAVLRSDAGFGGGARDQTEASAIAAAKAVFNSNSFR